MSTNDTPRFAIRGIRRPRVLGSVALALGLLLALTPDGAGPAAAEPVAHPAVVSDDPANWTPNVMDGRVNSVARIGNTIYVGGTFSTVVEPRGPRRELERHNLFAFDVDSRAVVDSFVPDVDGQVRSIVADETAGTLYVGGSFRTVNGVSSRGIAAIDAATGSSRAGFSAPGLNGTVNDVKLLGDRLIIGGTFNYVGPTSRTALASLNASTGALTNYMVADLVTTRTGLPSILKMQVTPDAERLIVIGNFTSAFGSVRHQIAVIRLDQAPASLRNWTTTWYSAPCSAAFDTYMRDLDISPDGSYFVVTTTGAYRAQPSPCDTQARFETRSTGGDQMPTWVSYTGGDTSYAASITGTAVYIGGHFRWVNNPFAGDSAGPGAVPRSGLVALDPRNGIPLTWDPGRTRGVGVFDMLATDDGLWITSDTDRVNDERHGRIAFFPLAGGSALPAEETGTLPADVYLLGNRASGQDRTLSRWVHANGGAGLPSDAQEITGGADWRQTRGAVLIDDQLYTGWSDGSFTRRTFSNGSFGPAQTVNLYGGRFATEIANVRGMFYDKEQGRLYYTLTGKTALFWRGFSPESAVIGASRTKIPSDRHDLPAKRVAGMFLDGSTLYFGDKRNGRLRSLAFTGGEARGPVSIVNDTVNWRSYGAFISNETPGDSPYSRPNAALPSPQCQNVSCTFDASSSTARIGPLDYTWQFGDGSKGVGPRPTHSYPASGTYTATVTVTDRLGATDVADVSVVVSAKKAVVKVEARQSASVLFVDVNPNVGDDYWRFRVWQKVDGVWEPRNRYRTKGPEETRVIDLDKGRYRVVVKADHGRDGVTSSAVSLRR